ncbi:MAG: hypothetical protein KGI80_02505 [Verrucomicrobiota bacterium]|nr:hypothetical protein [Verrucomicrobiota bacterium]
MITTTAYQNILQKVESAYARRSDYNDFISSRLFEWLEEAKTGSFSEENLLKQLKEEALANPLIPSALLKEAVLERCWVWEKWMLEDFQKSFPSSSSPFDGEMMVRASEAKVHGLVTSILHELAGVPTVFSDALVLRGSGSALMSIGQNPEMLEFKKVYYGEMAQKYRATQNVLTEAWSLRRGKCGMALTKSSVAERRGKLDEESKAHVTAMIAEEKRGVASHAVQGQAVLEVQVALEQKATAILDEGKKKVETKREEVRHNEARIQELSDKLKGMRA